MTLFQTMKRDRKRVVIVDDSRTMQALLEQILSIRMGFDIVGIAADGESALAMIQNLRPDLVTIDLHMPYIDGRELLAQLTAFPAMHKVVISSSACDNLAIKGSLEKLGADACLSKVDMSRDPESFCKALLTVVAKTKRTTGKAMSSSGHDVTNLADEQAKRSPLAKSYPVPVDEQERLAALEALELANDHIDHQLDLLTAHMATTTGFSACTMTFIDRHTQWIKSAYGVDRGASVRAQAFCNYTLCADDLFIVHDARSDDRFANFEPVVSGPMIRSYVGCPIVTSTGVRLGALCLIDTKPRRITIAELNNLRSIARIAASLIEGRMAPMGRAA